MLDTIAECERAGVTEGLAAGVELALAGTTATAAPGTVAALASTAVPAHTPTLHHELAEQHGISLVPNTVPDAVPDARRILLAARLASARLGVTGRLLATVIAHLAGRVSGGEPMIRKQLVQGALADAQVNVEVLRQLLRSASTSDVAVADVHDRLSEQDWELAKLLGASGYAGAAVAGEVFVSRLVANCWLARRES
jgi:hypothetical protein